MQKIKVGVFGGGRGYLAISTLYDNPYATLVAVCDNYEPLLESVKKRAEDAGMTNVGYYTDFDKFLQHDMDAVVMANYAHEHAKYAVRVLNSGRHVLSECLLSANMAEAVELVDAVEKSGKIYHYAENYCFTPARVEMRKRYRRGDIGELMYAEGEYLHDCSPIWPEITYGQRNHWRNLMSSTFYCTHAIGPILHMTGLRPTKVVGFETPCMPFMYELGTRSGSMGCQMLTLENGAFMKSLNFNIKTPYHSHYQINGDIGGLYEQGGLLRAYIEERGKNGKGINERYYPQPEDEKARLTGHGGGDYYTTDYFFRAILGDEDAKKNAVDVYEGCDMSLPGILAYRSILEGNTPQTVPNFRIKEERERYRHDTFCTFPEAAGDMYADNGQPDVPPIPDETFEKVYKMWKERE